MSDAVPPRLFDTHCHLTHGELSEDSQGAWERARAAGVLDAVLIGIDVDSSKEVEAFAAARPGLWAAVGIHPNDVGNADEKDVEALRPLCGREKVIAVGESGLDAYWDRAPMDRQERFLELHAELALHEDLPLVLHLRDAYPRAAQVLEPFAGRGLRAIVHCFGGEPEEIHPFVDWDWPISFSGILTYGKADNVRGAATATPEHLLLLETDAPWLTPAARRGQTNEPAFVVETARELARVRGVDLQEIARITTANALRTFGLTPSSEVGRPEGAQPE